MKVFVVAVAGGKEHQRIQIAVLAENDGQARDKACFLALERYDWLASATRARIVAHEGEPLQPPIMQHTPDRVVPV